VESERLLEAKSWPEELELTYKAIPFG